MLAWVREDGDERLLCAVELRRREPVAIEPPGALVVSTDPDRGGGDVRELHAGEAVIVAV